jgi:hypothetical protein
MPRASAAARLAWLSYPLSVIAMRGRMSGPMSSDVSNCVLSLTSPPVRWKSRGLPSRSVLRWILVEKPPRERPSAWRCCPFCPGGQDVGACCGAVEELDQVCRLAAFRQQLKEYLEYPRATEPPEPLPYALPLAIFVRKCMPCYAVYCEVVQRFQEFTVVMARLSPARLRRIKHFQHDRPIALRHPRQHVRLPDAGHAVIRTKPDSGIHQKSMARIPSTRPSVIAATDAHHSTART